MYINNILLILKILTSTIYNKSNKYYNYINYNNKYFINYSLNSNNWDNHKNTILKINNFKANGNLIYTDGIKKVFLNFNWDNIHSKHFMFKAYTFFGIKLIEFIYNSGNVYLKNFGKEVLQYKNLKDILKKTFNTNIPIDNLRYWIIGLPGNSKTFTLNKNGYLKEIQYIDNNNNICKIIYTKYNIKFYPPVPENIELYYNNNKLIFNIKNWNFK